MAAWLVLAALLLAALAWWLYRRATALRRDSGLPPGRVTYVDTGSRSRCERPLFSERHLLTGRPDYLVRTRAGLVPVEVKSGQAPAQPYPAHVLQLGAYCLLVEEQDGRAPPHGVIQYSGRAFEVDNTPALRGEVLRTLEAMREDLRAGEVERSHDDPARCQGCGFRTACERSCC